mmetsp:Transcript_18353/g.42136  ORF Transcript_18353/g.42136 Transcript_18353/m.42136 type:complete len:258 (-) Transcript_18353:431-1204(-)
MTLRDSVVCFAVLLCHAMPVCHAWHCLQGSSGGGEGGGGSRSEDTRERGCSRRRFGLFVAVNLSVLTVAFGLQGLPVLAEAVDFVSVAVAHVVVVIVVGIVIFIVVGIVVLFVAVDLTVLTMAEGFVLFVLAVNVVTVAVAFVLVGGVVSIFHQEPFQVDFCSINGIDRGCALDRKGAEGHESKNQKEELGGEHHGWFCVDFVSTSIGLSEIGGMKRIIITPESRRLYGNTCACICTVFGLDSEMPINCQQTGCRKS